MGRFIKNYELPATGHAVRLPVGSNLVGPTSPVNGQIRYNVNNVAGIEYYNNGTWHSLASIGNVIIQRDAFTGDGVNLSFTMTVAHTDPKEILVFIGGVFQDPGLSFTVSATNLLFTSAPPLGYTIVVLHNFNSTRAV